MVLLLALALGGCEARKAPVVIAAPPNPQSSRLSDTLCADTNRPRGYRVEREALAPVLAQEAASPPDYRRAYELAFALARQGNSAAILHLADLYRNPATGFADPGEAARLDACGLRLGAPPALVWQGINLSQTAGPADARRADRKAAVGLFERAAALGDLEGIDRLAHLVAAGRGFPASPALGRELLDLCAATGDHACQSDLARDMAAEGHVEGAYFWLCILAAHPAVDDPANYAARRDALLPRLSAEQIRRTKASTAIWRRLSWGEVEWRWDAARDRLLAAI